MGLGPGRAHNLVVTRAAIDRGSTFELKRFVNDGEILTDPNSVWI